MLKTFAGLSVVLVSLAHFVFMILEATIWPTEFGQKLTHLSASAAQETIGVGLNMALYNGFVGFALLWATLALSDREAYSAQWLFLTFIILAGVVGAVTMQNPGIFVAQSLPALIALGLTWLTRPYARTEADAIQQICAIERQILAIKSVDPKLDPKPADGTVPRGQHPKMHGLVEARFIVADDLPQEMRAGIFSEPGKSFDAVARFSNARNADDRDRGGHGMAIKLLNVGHGAGPSGATQDFVLFDSPVFFIGTPIQYVQFEAATLRAYGKSKAGTLLTSVLSYYWRHPRQLINLFKTQRTDVIDPLAIRYFSVVPYQLGSLAVKYSARPVGACAEPAAGERSKHMLRAAMKAHISRTDIEFLEFEFQVQAQSDAASMPIEDPTKLWDETLSRPVTVARLKIPTGQQFDEAERRAFGEHLSFTPWHALPEHAPLGGINRVRRAVYESLSEFRHALNHVPRRELDSNA